MKKEDAIELIEIGMWKRFGLTREGIQSKWEDICRRREANPYPHELCFCLPSDVPVEMAGILLRIAFLSNNASEMFVNFASSSEEDNDRILNGLITMLIFSTPVLWKYDLMTIADNGCESFDGMPFDRSVVDPPMQLWIPDRDLVLTNDMIKMYGLEGGHYWLHLATLVVLPEYVGHTFHNPSVDLSYTDMVAALIFGFVEGNQYPIKMVSGGIANGKIGLETCQIAAMLQFMHQPIVEVQRYGPDRAERRRLQHQGIQKTSPTLYVKLRPRASARTETGEHVDWSCRWIVRTHWRKQWYPSEQHHRPALIHSYVKGPDDKPLRMHKGTVVSVER